MNHLLKACCLIGLSVSILAPAAHADEFQLSNNQRISCGRGLSPGKLSTATCKSYAYVFNTKTSEYYRCSVSMSLTRDNKEVISNQSEGGCVKKPRIFDTDSSYSFDATETEPPNTNSFFGSGRLRGMGQRQHRAQSPRLHHHQFGTWVGRDQVPGHEVRVTYTPPSS